MKAISTIFGLFASITSLAQASQVKSFVNLTPRELTAIIAKAQASHMPPQEIQKVILTELAANGRITLVESKSGPNTFQQLDSQISLINSLQQKNRVKFVESAEADNCGEHSCDSTTGG